MCLGQADHGGEEAACVPASHTMAVGPVPRPLPLPGFWAAPGADPGKLLAAVDLRGVTFVCLCPLSLSLSSNLFN